MKRHIIPSRAENKERYSLTLIFAVIVFVVLLLAIALSALTVYIFSLTGLIGGFDDEITLGTLFIGMLSTSVILGAGISLLLAQFPLKSVNNFINHMNSLASGDFKTRLEFNGSFKNHKVFKEISESFNKLAEELENTEMLRADFINNFSHEFKTPIVSIAGLAKLVNKGNLTTEERNQYLTAIEEESLRLASMATNVLNLTKVENQTILTDISKFNLSEQIRFCILLLENKWVEKEIELSLDFDEHTVNANEELLKQIWINLVDNAIKFSPVGGKLCVSISDIGEKFKISVSNEGDAISEENKVKIFNKFYQIDESHASVGNGIGLAIVKRIVALHSGDICVDCKDNIITFTVLLPKTQ